MKKIFLILSFIIIIFTVSGCGAKGTNGESSTAIAQTDGVMQNEVSFDQSTDISEVTSNNESTEETWKTNEKKIIRTFDMEVETTEFDFFFSEIRKNVETSGGYVQNSSVYGNRINQDGSQQLRYGSMTLRIPKDKTDNILLSISEKSNVIYQNEYTDDISLRYYDTESRKKALEIEQERLLSLLEQAEDIDSVIQLEERLTEVRWQLESYTSTLKQYDNMVDCSTINIQVNEVKNITQQQGEGILSQMGQGIIKSFQNLGEICKDAVLLFVINLPYLLILAIIVVVIVFFLRRKKKKVNFSSLKNEEEHQEK